MGPGPQPGPRSPHFHHFYIPSAVQGVCRWNGADLDHNQDPARQALCDYLDGVGGAASLFDFPMKGILQARPWPAMPAAPCRQHGSAASRTRHHGLAQLL